MRIARRLLPSRATGPDEVDPGLPEAYDEGRFLGRLDASEFATELFVSSSHARWEKGRFAIQKDTRVDAETDISGVRFQAHDESREDLSLERETQIDVVELVRGLRDLRSLPGLDNVVLLKDDLRERQPIKKKGTRVKFGLKCPAKGKGRDDIEAATRSHKAIRRAIRHSGLIVQHPPKYDPKTGLAGLEQWGASFCSDVASRGGRSCSRCCCCRCCCSTAMDRMSSWASRSAPRACW